MPLNGRGWEKQAQVIQNAVFDSDISVGNHALREVSIVDVVNVWGQLHQGIVGHGFTELPVQAKMATGAVLFVFLSKIPVVVVNAPLLIGNRGEVVEKLFHGFEPVQNLLRNLHVRSLYQNIAESKIYFKF